MTLSFDKIELYIKNQMYARALPEIMARFGTDVEVIRVVQKAAKPKLSEAYRKMYGQFSDLSSAPTDNVPGDLDGSENVRFDARILIGFARFMRADDGFASDFETNTMVTDAPVAPGDIIRIKRDDAVRKTWRVLDDERMGITTQVYRRWPIAATGE